MKISENVVTLDGRLDEAVWNSAEEHTGFCRSRYAGEDPAPVKTSFRILTEEDRIYIGVWCEEPYLDTVLENCKTKPIWSTDCVELFFSPTGSDFDFYHFAVTVDGQTASLFYSEAGHIKPDPYAPQWRSAVHRGENFWSVEVEIPLTAFYMTPADSWSSSWRVNVCRDRVDYQNGTGTKFYSWSKLNKGYIEPASFRVVDGMPERPAADAVSIRTAEAEIASKTDAGLFGTLQAQILAPEDGEFVFAADCCEGIAVSLKKGSNMIAAPCCFAEEGRQQIGLQLTRSSDGKVFKRWYPVRVAYEPIKLELSLPEYRGNFYPGQDWSKVAGKVIANKPVTVTLEGPGIGKKTVTPDADGNFVMDTPDFAVGEALLTITDCVDTFTRKIRRLAPTGHMMTWISGGNLIVNGKPTLRRNMYAEYYHGGEAFKARYDADDLHQTPGLCAQKPAIEPFRLIKGVEAPGGEATRDVKPCDEMFEKLDAVIEANREKDFAYYYLEDEPECRGISPVYLKHMYDYLAEKDPYHVVLIASREPRNYVDCFDWVEVHPYINISIQDGKRCYGRAINTLGSFVDNMVKLGRQDKCVGFLPTCFSSGSIYSDYPNFEEMVCHVWAAMLPGGKTLWPFAYLGMNDRACLYEGIRYVFSSFAALEDLVLHAKRTDLVKDQQVHGVLYELGEEKMFVLVNMVDTPQTVTLDGISGNWYNFRHGGSITGNSFALAPFEVVIGTTEKRDAGLPTYQETVAKIEEAEYARTHGGSLLFDRHRDLRFTASVKTPHARMLFDGVKDNYAIEMPEGEGERFFEIDLTGVKPVFSKVVVHGYQIDDMQMQLRMNGTLSAPAAKVETGAFSKTFLLDEPTCPDGLRLEFGQRKMELYEIEVF